MHQQRPLAVSIMPLETRLDTIRHVATQADELGYDTVFLTETWSYATPVLLTEIATQTKNINLGTGIIAVWNRSAATIAMEAATLNAISNGRFVLGLGSSTPQLTEGLHDVPYTRPIAKMRETIKQVRSLLNGDRIPLGVATDVRSLRLNIPEITEVPIYLAGSSPESVRLAGELCDGWYPYLIPRDWLAEGIALLKEGASRSGSAERKCVVGPAMPAVVAETTAKAREGAAWVVAFYITTMGRIYRSVLSRLGYDKEVQVVIDANPDRNPSIVPPEAEALLEQLTVYGTADEVRQKLDLWYEAGAEMPTLHLNPNLSTEEIDSTLNAFR